jgi:signal transduction histidine kinase
MRLYQKGLLAFVLVILVAVGTIALLVGQRTEREFRAYTALYSGRAQSLAASLIAYHADHGSWEGLQEALTSSSSGPGMHGGPGGGMALGGLGRQGGMAWDFRVADRDGQVVAHLEGTPEGTFTRDEIASALPLQGANEIVGYLLPDQQQVGRMELGGAEEAFLSQMHAALGWGAAGAFIAALLVGGLLMRGIVKPVQRLTQTAQEIAGGNLQVRAPVSGRDEIAQLSQTFNEMAQSLEDAEAARRAQTADIAHELRNPLSVLQGTLEALTDGVYEPTPENLLPMVDQVRTLNRLVEDLRLLALFDAGELHMDVQPLDPTAFLRRVAEAHRLSLEEKGLTFDVAVPEILPAVSADPDRLAQVVGNILGNAVHYVPAGGTVRLTSEAQEDGVAVRIADDGPGVPTESLPHLFERFWRGDPSRSRATGGSGLGLAIARRIVEAHGGRIGAELTPGGGLTFVFWLPAAVG